MNQAKKQHKLGLLKLSKREDENLKMAGLTEIKMYATKPTEKKVESENIKIHHATKPSFVLKKQFDSKLFESKDLVENMKYSYNSIPTNDPKSVKNKSANIIFKVASKPTNKCLEDVEINEPILNKIVFKVASKPLSNHTQENKSKDNKSIFVDSEFASIVKVKSVNQKNKGRSLSSKNVKQVIHNFTQKAASGENFLSFPSIEELLRIPSSDSKMKDDYLDDLDGEIALSRKKHEQKMASIDSSIAAEKLRQEERIIRFGENSILKNRLEIEITEPLLRKMFKENIQYLMNILEGKVKSVRHEAFHKSCKTRHELFYQMITDPYTDDQLNWTLDELSQVWMKTEKEYLTNNEYVWKVLMPEFFIKMYMDYFNLQKMDAEKRISETPLQDEDAESEGDL